MIGGARHGSARWGLGLVLAGGLGPSACVEVDPSYGLSTGGDAASTGAMPTGGDSTASDGSSGGSNGSDSGPGPQVDRNVAFVTAASFPPPLGGIAVADDHN